MNLYSCRIRNTWGQLVDYICFSSYCRKFEEIYPPEVAEFVYITDDTYTKKQVLRMEHLVLKVLSFDLAAPTINQFLSQYFLHQPACSLVENLAMVSVGIFFFEKKQYLNISEAVLKKDCSAIAISIF